MSSLNLSFQTLPLENLNFVCMNKTPPCKNLLKLLLLFLSRFLLEIKQKQSDGKLSFSCTDNNSIHLLFGCTVSPGSNSPLDKFKPDTQLACISFSLRTGMRGVLKCFLSWNIIQDQKAYCREFRYDTVEVLRRTEGPLKVWQNDLW